MQEILRIKETYNKLLTQQKFVEEELDYDLLQKHISSLQKLAKLGNSMISVFDVFKQQHVFYSSNVGAIFGYTQKEITAAGGNFLDIKIHPDDYMVLLQNSLSIFKLFLNFSEDEKMNHKLINEYRILTVSGDYIKVIEQHQVLEVDKHGNFWLALSILDISPDQDLNEGLKCQVLNYRTGKFIGLFKTKEESNITLTQREIEILKLVKKGLLSKEISDKLSISVHTVNTHRQRVLEKLGVDNSIEAVILASRLGLV